MAQCNDSIKSWNRGQRPDVGVVDAAPQSQLWKHPDDLSRFIDEKLSGVSGPPLPHANRSAEVREWFIFAAMMALAIWGMVKVSLL